MTAQGSARRRQPFAVWAAAFVAAWLLLNAFSGACVLVIDVDSTVPGSAQVFYRSSGQTYSEGASVRAPLRVGANQLRFELPGLQRRLRWDPFDGAGTLVVRRIGAEVWGSAVSIDFARVTNGLEIARMGLRDGVFLVETEPDATDPSVIIDMPASSIFWAKQLGAISIAALGLGIVFLCLRLDGAAKRVVSRLRRLLTEERQALRALPYLIAIAAAFHFSSLATFAVSPDDEYAAFRTNNDVWITQGRWTIYLVERFVLPQPTVPYLPNAIFCVCVALAYVLLCRAHGLGTTWRTYALFPVFCAFPTWAYLAEFYANLPSASLGLVLSSAAAAVFARTFVRREEERLAPSAKALGVALQAVLLATAMGAYQSYLFAFVAFGLGILVVTAFSNGEIRPRQLGTMLGWLGASSVAGLFLYQRIQALALSAAGVRVSYIEQFMQFDLLREHPGDRVKFVFDEVVSVYSGSSALYGASLGCIGVLVVVGATSLVFVPNASGWTWRKAALLVFAAAVLFLPIALMAVAPDLPMRSLVGVPYAVWLFGLLATMHPLQIPRVFGVLTALVSAFQFAYLLSLYAANVAVTGSHDRELAEAIYERVASVNENFDRRRPYSVDFFGAKSVNVDRYPAAHTTTMSRTMFDWDHGNPDRIVTYMTLLGYDNLRTVSEDQRRMLIPEFRQMPTWPAAGSVKVVDGITLVRLGSDPDPSHGRGR